MKIVMSSEQVAHVWAQQNQPEARNAGRSFSFRGERAYSYSAHIASFVRGRDGTKVVLFAERFAGYSVTTQRHFRHLNGALLASTERWNAPEIGFETDAAVRTEDTERKHARNLRHLRTEYIKARDALMKCQAGNWQLSDIDGGAQRDVPTHAHATLREAAHRVTSYIDTFGISINFQGIERSKYANGTDLLDVLDWPGDAGKAIARRDRLLNSPAARARAAKAERKRAEEARLAALTNAERIAEWRAGTLNHLYGGRLSDEHGGAMLRVRGDVVQTSWGAEVPVSHAVRALKMWGYCFANSKVINPADDMPGSRQLGHFHLDSIDSAGTVKAGCHTIYASELQRLAAALTTVADRGSWDANGSPV